MIISEKQIMTEELEALIYVAFMYALCVSGVSND